MNNTYIQNEAKKDFKDWTKDGLEFLLHNTKYKDIAINALSKLLELNGTIEFTYNNLYYEIFRSADSNYVVNIYSSDKKDEDAYIESNLVDGGLCTGSARDAIKFMLDSN